MQFYKRDLFRREQKPLATKKLIWVGDIKAEAENLLRVIEVVDAPEFGEADRCIRKAKEKLEEAVMWAVKGATA